MEPFLGAIRVWEPWARLRRFGDDVYGVRFRVGSETIVSTIEFCRPWDGSDPLTQIIFSEPVRIATGLEVANVLTILDPSDNPVRLTGLRGIFATRWLLYHPEMPPPLVKVQLTDGVRDAADRAIRSFNPVFQAQAPVPASGLVFSQTLTWPMLPFDDPCHFWVP